MLRRRERWPKKFLANWRAARTSRKWRRLIPQTAAETSAATGAGSSARRSPRRWKKSPSTCQWAELATSSNTAAIITSSRLRQGRAALLVRWRKLGLTSRRSSSRNKLTIYRNAGWPACAQKLTFGRSDSSVTSRSHLSYSFEQRGRELTFSSRRRCNWWPHGTVCYSWAQTNRAVRSTRGFPDQVSVTKFQ